MKYILDDHREPSCHLLEALTEYTDELVEKLFKSPHRGSGQGSGAVLVSTLLDRAVLCHFHFLSKAKMKSSATTETFINV